MAVNPNRDKENIVAAHAHVMGRANKSSTIYTVLKRNCSDETFLVKRTDEYKGCLLYQGHPSKLVNDQFSKTSTISRNDLLRTRGKEENKLFPFVISFNPNITDIGDIIRKHLFILQSNS